jgi:mRNA interferase MazF
VSETPRQGDIWWATVDRGRRPVLVVTRSGAIPVLSAILVAPITRTIRGIPTEIALGRHHGLRTECCATLDNLKLIRNQMLTERVGRLEVDELPKICGALEAMADC